MLDGSKKPSHPKPYPEAGVSETVSISELVEQITGFIRRQLPIFLFITACSIGLGLTYLFATPARYTAHAMLLIDSSKVRMLQQQQSSLGDVPLDTAQVETQVEVLKSENIGLSVIRDLRLTERSEFSGSSGGLLGAVFGFLSGASGLVEPKSETELARRALRTFLGGRTISRVGRTYVLDISYTSLDRGSAAAIANGIADAYIVDQLEAKYQTTKRAGAWLQDRIKELRLQATAADRAVLDYKEKNKIVDAGASNIGQTGGRLLLGEQQLAELSTQLSAVRGAKAEAKAKLDRITEVMKQEIPDAGVADSLRSEVINRLRNQYLDLSARERIWSTRYGQNHLAAVNLRNQMVELRRSISDELGRIAESYKSDYEIETTREVNLSQNLSRLVSESQSTNRDRLGLRDLESQAQVYHTIYDNFLQRYMEAIQQESFPITEARVISNAAPPLQKSSPVSTLVLAVAGALGLILSFGAATVREAVDRVFRSSRQVEEMLQTTCLAVLPALKQLSIAPLSGGASSQDVAIGGRKPGDLPRKGKSTKREFLRYVVEEPLSAFAEALRSVKVAADINRDIKDNRVIGITSTVPKEGKSTVSSNFAQLIAHAGKRAILLDGDLRNPTLTRSLMPEAKIGLLEVMSGKVTLANAITVDDQTGLAFLPAVIQSRLLHTNEILASDALKRLVETLRKSYDYVIIDLPPVAPVVDVRATTNVIDSYIYVVEWGKTGINLVQHQLAGMPEVHSRLLGVILNKANLKVLERYEYYYGSYYHKKYYSRYGYGS
jgi:succinoglycan biosynthesis transport protein ExoP